MLNEFGELFLKLYGIALPLAWIIGGIVAWLHPEWFGHLH